MVSFGSWWEPHPWPSPISSSQCSQRVLCKHRATSGPCSAENSPNVAHCSQSRSPSLDDAATSSSYNRANSVLREERPYNGLQGPAHSVPRALPTVFMPSAPSSHTYPAAVFPLASGALCVSFSQMASRLPRVSPSSLGVGEGFLGHPS